ncbi:MAG: DNA primase catalytic subunit PriS [Candidatus Methanoperedens sp.]|nr:DNA primase catalytic subunit PriS [Candidatus Methanoperedens sp.]
MNFRTKQFLRKRFSDYYQNSQLILPHDFPRREWGFIFFDELPEVVMRRHKAFSRENEALDYIRGMVPAHAYHSAAYYEFPGAATMKEKKWQGADLIFDLDADHLPAKVYSYKGMLDNVKSETAKLLDFLIEDFGFSENNTSIVFSGGRGYHIHVHDPKVFTLESAERREIVDYVSGTGLSIDYLFKPEKFVAIDTGRGYMKKEFFSPRKVSSFDETSEGFGWGKRISRYIISFLKGISTKDEVDAINEITEIIKNYNLKNVQSGSMPDEIAESVIQMKNETPNISNKKIAEELGIYEKKVLDILIANDLKDFSLEAKRKLKKIKKKAQNPKALNMIETKGIIDDEDLFNAIVLKAIEDNSINLGSAHTDEPVTADIKRLIRMPNSLHGGSGMRVVPLSMSEFRDFEPLNDAVVFSEKMIEIEAISPLKPQFSKIEMKGKSFTVSEGKNTLPEYAAIYLMSRGAAEYA